MNPAIAAVDGGAEAVHQRPRPAPGRAIADSGLRLLIGAAVHRPLRWSLDPNAPDARALQPGELRLAICWVELSTHELQQAAAAASRRAGREGSDWQAVAAVGCAQVTESRAPGCRRGQWLCGPLHVGTHRVLRVVAIDGTGCVATGAADDPAAAGSLYAWIPQPPAEPDTVGQDAVEKAVRALQDPGPADPHRLRLSLRSSSAAGRCRHVPRGGPRQDPNGQIQQRRRP